MAKELPFFKFEPNAWENGNIQMLSRECKGLFIDICSMYWSRLGDLPAKLVIQKLCAGNATALNPLCDENIIEVIDGNIYIQFLTIQLQEFETTSSKNSENARLGWEKRRKQKASSDRNATASKSQSETKAIREEKIREEEIREDFLLKKETKDLKGENQNSDKNPEPKASKKVAQKKVSIDDLEMPPEFVPIWEEWRQYRRDRKFKNYAAPKYEQIAVNKFLEMADNNPETARQIIQQTFAHNYQGLFPLKNTNNGTNQFTNNRTAGNTAGSGTSGSAHVSGKTSFNQIFARKLKASGNSESGNITIDAEVVE